MGLTTTTSVTSTAAQVRGSVSPGLCKTQRNSLNSGRLSVTTGVSIYQKKQFTKETPTMPEQMERVAMTRTELVYHFKVNLKSLKKTSQVCQHLLASLELIIQQKSLTNQALDNFRKVYSKLPQSSAPDDVATFIRVYNDFLVQKWSRHIYLFTLEDL